MKKILKTRRGNFTRDPFMFRHNGKYYHCFTEDFRSISVSCADTVEGLADATAQVVFTPEGGCEYSELVWAPELHILDGVCYIYVAACDGDNANHRMFVLENGCDDPQMPYSMHGKIFDDTDKWAIDGTVMEYNGKRYYAWSGWEGDENSAQQIYIAEMKSPYEIGERHLISQVEYDWEKIGSDGVDTPFINEGPACLRLDGECYMLYSASGSWCEGYCIAALKLVGDDPLERSSWLKTKEPILCANDKLKGAGHCSVICQGDSAQVFFHAWDADQTDIIWETVSVWHGILRKKDGKLVIE